MLGASRRARQSIDGLREGERLPDGLLSGDAGIVPLVVPYDVSGRRERLVYLCRDGRPHGVRGAARRASPRPSRTSCARRSRGCSRSSRRRRSRARTSEISSTAPAPRSSQITELIDEVLFLSELESGARVVSLGADRVLPVLEEASSTSSRSGRRAPGSTLGVECDDDVELDDPPADAARGRAEPRRERDPLRRPGRDVHARGRARATGRSCSRARRRHRRRRGRARRGSSSASTAPTARAPRAGRGSGSRSSSTSSRRRAARVEARGGRGRGLEVRCTFPAPLTRATFTSSSPDLHHRVTHGLDVAGILPTDTSALHRDPRRRRGSHADRRSTRCGSRSPRRSLPSLRAAAAERARPAARSPPTARARSARSRRRPPRTSEGETPAATSRSGSPAPVAASSASAAARPTSRTPRARSRTRRRRSARRTASSTSSSRSRTTRSRSSSTRRTTGRRA